MSKIALTLPSNGSSTSTPIPVPSGLPSEVTGGLRETGTALFQTSYNWVFLIGVFLAVVAILFSGIQMVTSGGDSEKLARARMRLIFGIIGLVVVVGAFFIVNVVIRMFGGSPEQFIR